jgi:hypothetical protein
MHAEVRRLWQRTDALPAQGAGDARAGRGRRAVPHVRERAQADDGPAVLLQDNCAGERIVPAVLVAARRPGSSAGCGPSRCPTRTTRSTWACPGAPSATSPPPSWRSSRRRCPTVFLSYAWGGEHHRDGRMGSSDTRSSSSSRRSCSRRCGRRWS